MRISDVLFVSIETDIFVDGLHGVWVTSSEEP